MNTKLLRPFSLIAFAACVMLGLTHGVAQGAVTGLFVASIAWIAFEFCVAKPFAGCGVNTLGTVAASAVIIQEALDLVFTVRPVLNEITLDLKAEKIAKQGQQVISRIFSVPAVGNFGDAAQAKVDVDVPVTINNLKQVMHTFTYAELNATDRQLVRESAMPLAVAIANHMVDALAALWTIANFPTATTLANGWDYQHLVTVRQAMVTRGLPEGLARFYQGNADVYASLLQDPMVVAAQNNPSNGAAIASGRLGTVAGFALGEYPALPVTGNLVGFAGTKDSTVLAARVPSDPRELLPNAPYPGTLQPITHERTGLTVLLNEFIGQSDLTANVRLIWAYGCAVGNANNGQIIKSQ